jgi:hypothetical protein
VEETFATKLGIIPPDNAKADEAPANFETSLAEKTSTPQIDKSD